MIFKQVTVVAIAAVSWQIFTQVLHLTYDGG